MNDESFETKKLAAAVASFAEVVVEIITKRIRHLEAGTEMKIHNLPTKVADPVLNKKELAQRLRVGMRTIDTWMKQGRLPYVKLGQAVRFRWSEVERHGNDGGKAVRLRSTIAVAIIHPQEAGKQEQR